MIPGLGYSRFIAWNLSPQKRLMGSGMTKFSSLGYEKLLREWTNILLLSFVIIMLASYAINYATYPFRTKVGDAFAQTDTKMMTIQIEQDVGLSIIVTGKVAALEKTNDGQDVTIANMQVYGPNGTIFRTENTTVNTFNGEYKFHINFENDTGNEIKYAPVGLYKIVVTYGLDQRAEIEYNFFTVSTAPQPVPAYQILIDGKNYTLHYRLVQPTAGNLAFHNMTLNSPNKSLLVNIESDIKGTLVIELPRALINSSSYSEKSEKMDVSFVVLVDGRKLDNFNELIGPNFEKRTLYGLDNSNSTAVRDLEINFTSGTKQIEIMGTELVPEFDGFASFAFMIGTAASVTGINFMLRRFRLRKG